MKVRWRQGRNPQQEESFVVCISDLMAGLVSIFVITLVYYILNFSQATAQLTENDVKRAAILNSVKQEMQLRGFEIKVDPDHGVLTLPEGVLFDVGEAQIKEKGVDIISNLGQVLVNILNRTEYEGSVETIFVEGHTDNAPINTPEFPSNWELSTKRAINTWLTLSKISTLPALKNKKGEMLFSCSGYAETRPASSNATEETRQDNRRIDLRFTLTPPTKDEAGVIKAVRKVMNSKE